MTRGDGLLTELVEGAALSELRVLAMYHRIQLRQYHSAERLIDRAVALTHATDARLAEFEVGAT